MEKEKNCINCVHSYFTWNYLCDHIDKLMCGCGGVYSKDGVCSVDQETSPDYVCDEFLAYEE